MNELKLQSLIVDAVNEAHGFAHKQNNRFIIGVADLLVKLPDQYKGSPRTRPYQVFPAGVIEVKQRPYPSSDKHFRLDVTPLQVQYLRNAHAAGMPSAVASFLQQGTGSGLKLWLNISTYKSLFYTDQYIEPFSLSRGSHLLLSRDPRERANDILTHLYNWHNQERRP